MRKPPYDPINDPQSITDEVKERIDNWVRMKEAGESMLTLEGLNGDFKKVAEQIDDVQMMGHVGVAAEEPESINGKYKYVDGEFIVRKQD